MHNVVGAMFAAGIVVASLGYGPAAYAAPCGATLQAEATAIGQAVEQAKVAAKSTTVEWYHGTLADGSSIRSPSKELLAQATAELNTKIASETVGEKTFNIVKGMFRALTEAMEQALPKTQGPQQRQIENIGVRG